MFSGLDWLNKQSIQYMCWHHNQTYYVGRLSKIKLELFLVKKFEPHQRLQYPRRLNPQQPRLNSHQQGLYRNYSSSWDMLLVHSIGISLAYFLVKQIIHIELCEAEFKMRKVDLEKGM
jgi:hypothetical protein